MAMTDELPDANNRSSFQDWSAGAQPLTRRLKQLTERVRAADSRHPLIWDALLAGTLLTLALFDVASRYQPTALAVLRLHVPGWLAVMTSAGFTVPLLWRRTHPVAALAPMVACSLVNIWSGALLQATFLQLIVIFSIALRLPLRTLAWSSAAVAAPMTIGSWHNQFAAMVNGLLMVALLGLAVRTRREYTASLVERAHRLEVERDQQARLAAAAERARIAREMHDIIGHNLSVITGLADGGSYAARKNPPRATEALDAIATTSRQALTELRRLLGVLRDDSPAPAHPEPQLTPQPALSDLGPLLDGVTAAGLPVHLTVHGKPTTLPAGQQLTVYRVVQEALTNTLKHAGPDATSQVSLNYTPQSITATVTDTGRSTRGMQGIRAEGRGITGMRERTSLYAGTLEAGPRPDGNGGWHVRLTLPTPQPPMTDKDTGP